MINKIRIDSINIAVSPNKSRECKLKMHCKKNNNNETSNIGV